MKILIAAFLVIVFCGGLVTVSAAEHTTLIPPGIEPATPGGDTRVPCDVLLRYDDGSDDDPGSGPTLGWYSSVNYQFLGVRFTPPATGPYKVQSASWFSDFWVLPGNVDVEVMEWNNPGNSTTATINVTGGGQWEVEFANPICIPQGGEYLVALCPQAGTWGVVGQDIAGPDGRSYWVGDPGGCNPVNPSGTDYMIWSCVTPCGATPVESSTWGYIKSIYR